MVEEEESSEDEFGLPRQLELEMGSDADAEEMSEGGEPDTDEEEEKEEERAPFESPQPQQGRLRTSAEFLAAVTIPGTGGDEGEGRGGDPLIRALRERGLPTRIPFGRYLGTSLRRMWETDHGKDYLLNFMGQTPAFYDRANTLQNRDMFMRLLESLHTLGYVTEVTDIHGRKVRAAAVLRAYRRDRLNALESSGPVPKPLPERTPIRHRRADDGEKTKRQRRLAPLTPAPITPTFTPTASTTTTAAASAAAAASPQRSAASASPASSSRGGRGLLSTPPPVPPGRLPPRAPLERHRAQSLFR